MPSKILWCDETWNPVRGCSRVSAGCDHCYAEMMAARFSNPGYWGEGLAKFVHGKPHWTGKIKLVPERLEQPLRWKKPRRIFVNSMSDLFHEGVPDEFIDRVFARMALCWWHKFLILTKRAGRAEVYCNSIETREHIGIHILDLLLRGVVKDDGHAVWEPAGPKGWPLPNVKLGVSVENQATADERVPHLLNTPAAFRFVSYEPALGPVDWVASLPLCFSCRGRLEFRGPDWVCAKCGHTEQNVNGNFVDLIIAGGESGPGARPAHPDWFRSTRDQCAEAGVAFFFKQWGEWAPANQTEHKEKTKSIFLKPDGTSGWLSESVPMVRIRKATAGRLLDGRTHDDLGVKA